MIFLPQKGWKQLYFDFGHTPKGLVLARVHTTPALKNRQNAAYDGHKLIVDTYPISLFIPDSPPKFQEKSAYGTFTAKYAENAEIFNFDFSSAAPASAGASLSPRRRGFSAVGSTVAERYARPFCLTRQYQVCRRR
jgi:hypothetical protein